MQGAGRHGNGSKCGISAFTISKADISFDPIFF
jgi:hypothetical protein